MIGDQPGYLSRISNSLHQPSKNMTWTQLAAATVFVLIVALMWRQVQLFIVGEL